MSDEEVADEKWGFFFRQGGEIMSDEEVADEKTEADEMFDKIHVKNTCPFCGFKSCMYEHDQKYNDSKLTVDRECVFCNKHWNEIYQLIAVVISA